MNDKVSSRPLLVAILALGLVSASLVGIKTPVSAQQKPTINDVEKVARRSLVLRISNSDMKNQLAVVRVMAKDTKTGRIYHRSVRTRFDGDGNARIRVRRLQPGTQYSLTVEVRGVRGSFSPASDSKTVTTMK